MRRRPQPGEEVPDTERKKKMTKVLLAESMRTLMLEKSFDKITIRMITDEAGVIRPTFYNYFCDKYEVLEWLFTEDIINRVRELFGQGMYTEGIKMIFVYMKKDQIFYKRAFEVHGQNSFKSIVFKYINELFLEDIGKSSIPGKTATPLLTADFVAGYYAMTLANILQVWIQRDIQDYSVEDMVDAYEYLLTHNIKDYMNSEK